MAPVGSLSVNDAPWLPANAARLAHEKVAIETAEALGAQSLRVHHQVRNQLPLLVLLFLLPMQF